MPVRTKSVKKGGGYKNKSKSVTKKGITTTKTSLKDGGGTKTKTKKVNGRVVKKKVTTKRNVSKTKKGPTKSGNPFTSFT